MRSWFFSRDKETEKDQDPPAHRQTNNDKSKLCGRSSSDYNSSSAAGPTATTTLVLWQQRPLPPLVRYGFFYSDLSHCRIQNIHGCAWSRLLRHGGTDISGRLKARSTDLNYNYVSISWWQLAPSLFLVNVPKLGLLSKHLLKFQMFGRISRAKYKTSVNRLCKEKSTGFPSGAQVFLS